MNAKEQFPPRPIIKNVQVRAKDLRVGDVMSVTDRQGRHHSWRRIRAVHNFDREEAVALEFNQVSGSKRWGWYEVVTIQQETGAI